MFIWTNHSRQWLVNGIHVSDLALYNQYKNAANLLSIQQTPLLWNWKKKAVLTVNDENGCQRRNCCCFFGMLNFMLFQLECFLTNPNKNELFWSFAYFKTWSEVRSQNWLFWPRVFFKIVLSHLCVKTLQSYAFRYTRGVNMKRMTETLSSWSAHFSCYAC